MSVRTHCTPRFEVLKGDLEDAIFAAEFGDLISNKAPKVYGDAATFFQNTHPAEPLRKVVQTVFSRLKNASEGGVTIRLSTGFGGGKTHTLMALWHLARNIGDTSLGAELLPAEDRPAKVKLVAVDLRPAGVPAFGQRKGKQFRSLWGDIFDQLNPETGLKSLGAADDPEASPNDTQIENVIPDGPVLILLDEVVTYMAKLSERGQGNLLGFISTLANIVGRRPQSCLVVTDSGSQAAYSAEAARLATQLMACSTRLEDVLGRKFSDYDPIGDESAKVIVRRLFERVDSGAAAAVAKTYAELYRRVLDSNEKALPPHAGTPGYEARVAECYPFHPRLLETAKDRLSTLSQFQQSRGVLRLFARILRDVWEKALDCHLISAGEIDWSSPRIQADLLQRLERDRFKAAVSADVTEHAEDLDGGKGGVHQRAASALLLESLPLTDNSGLDEAEVTLAILRPEEAGPEAAEALDRLAGVCWHLYPMPGGRGLQFRYEQNIIKQIDERRTKVSREDAESRIQAEVQSFFQGPLFKVRSWPSSPSQVPPTADLQLAICGGEKAAKAIVALEDDRDPSSPVPRRFRNAIIAISATEAKWEGAVERAQRLIAAEQIERENKSGTGSAEVREQLTRLLPDHRKQFFLQSYRAFDRVVLADGTGGTLDESHLVNEDNVLKKPNGQEQLLRYLTEKKLIYKREDALDSSKFKDILPGATPAPGETDVYTATAVHERMLSASGLRLIPGPDVVRNSLTKSLAAGHIVIRTADGSAYDKEGRVSGAPGSRYRDKSELNSLSLEDHTLVTLATSARAKEWLAEDTPRTNEGGGGGGGGKVPPPKPPPVDKVSAQTWEKILEYAAVRPLLELTLTAPAPALAATLPHLIQPLGADSVLLTVFVQGPLKDGGDTSFRADGVRINHPAKPLTIAQTLFNSAADGVTYEAQVVLTFNAPGRTGMVEKLELLREQAGTDIRPAAQFDKPSAA